MLTVLPNLDSYLHLRFNIGSLNVFFPQVLEVRLYKLTTSYGYHYSKSNSCGLNAASKKANVQTVIFATTFVTINGHTYLLYKNILNDVQTKGKGQINMA